MDSLRDADHFVSSFESLLQQDQASNQAPSQLLHQLRKKLDQTISLQARLVSDFQKEVSQLDSSKMEQDLRLHKCQAQLDRLKPASKPDLAALAKAQQKQAKLINKQMQPAKTDRFEEQLGQHFSEVREEEARTCEAAAEIKREVGRKRAELHLYDSLFGIQAVPCS